MSGSIQLAIAILGFAKELFKYLREKSEDNRDCAKKVQEATNGIKAAIQSKDTSHVERAFAELGIAGNGSGVDGSHKL